MFHEFFSKSVVIPGELAIAGETRNPGGEWVWIPACAGMTKTDRRLFSMDI